MSDSPLRLALVSHPGNLSVRSEALRRVHGGEVTVTADSLTVPTGAKTSNSIGFTHFSYSNMCIFMISQLFLIIRIR